MKFPSPYNTGKVVYKNKADECYKYEHEAVDCDKSTNVLAQPVTENFKWKK